MTTAAPARLSMPPHDHAPRPYSGPSKQEVLAIRKQYCHPSTFLYYRDPLMLVEGHMQYVYDETGRRYLDFFAGIVTVSCGHCHPRFVERVQAQVATLQHTTTIYLHPNFPLLARRLAGKMPAGLDVTYFVNSGSEANDLAVLMARLYTGNSDVIAVRNGYHGGSPTAMGLTSHATWKFPSQVSQGVHHAINPDPYRSPFTGSAEEIASRSAADIRDLVRFSTPGRIAAFIAEPIQGVGGTRWARRTTSGGYEIVREHGGLCIADEVQTGFGRTGDHFWGFETSGVVPDIVTMAKGIGNGLPLAAVTTRREIAEALTQRIHFNTFGGNPISMAGGLAVLDVIEEDGLQENCPRRRRTPQGRTQGADDPPPSHRRRAGHGTDARRRAGARPGNQGAGHAGDAGGVGGCAEMGLLHRQGRDRRERPSHQAADVRLRRRRGLCPRRPR